MLDFSKKDLKNGMAVKTRDENMYLVVDDMLLGECDYLYKSCFYDNLIFIGKYGTEFDIVAVYDVQYSLDFDKCGKLLWERPKDEDVKEVSM